MKVASYCVYADSSFDMLHYTCAMFDLRERLEVSVIIVVNVTNLI